MLDNTLTGKTIGKYQIKERLGRGGMAEVYLAYQENLERDVAIKVMHNFLSGEKNMVPRFKREAKATARLNHAHIVRVYDFEIFNNDTYFIVMEYVSGGTLKDRLEVLAEAGKRMPLAEAVRLMREVASALAYAHQRNMVHRDIKPANIMLTPDNKAVLTDFGIVKMLESAETANITATGAMLGTPAYMSPEQAMGQPGDARTDLYSLGVVFYQMVTGQLPFNADTPIAIVMQHVNANPQPPMALDPNIPPDVQTIILKALAKKPEDRFASAQAMYQALARVQLNDPAYHQPTSLAGGAVQPQPIGPTEVLQDVPTDEATAAAAAGGFVPPTVSVLNAIPTQPAVREQAQTKAGLPIWVYGLGGLAVLILGFFLFSFFGVGDGGGEEETAVSPSADAAIVLVAPDETETPTSEPTDEPTETPTSETAVAVVDDPTETPTATATQTATPTPTIDATATFLAGCTPEVTLDNVYTYTNPQFVSAPIGTSFPLTWVLENTGSCPIPAGSTWAYKEGEAYDLEEASVAIEDEVAVGETIELQTADFTAPFQNARYDSTWQLFDPDGEPFGDPITFEVLIYLPATATPVATPTPIATNTPEAPETTELNYLFEISNCEYRGAEWRCFVRFTPYGGAGGPYVMFIFDQPGGGASEIRSAPYDYFIGARRCANYNQEIVVRDEPTGLQFSRHLFVDPDDHFPGGCTEQ